MRRGQKNTEVSLKESPPANRDNLSIKIMTRIDYNPLIKIQIHDSTKTVKRREGKAFTSIECQWINVGGKMKTKDYHLANIKLFSQGTSMRDKHSRWNWVGNSIFTQSSNISTQIPINYKQKRKFIVEKPSRHHLSQRIDIIICNLTNKDHVTPSRRKWQDITNVISQWCTSWI